MPATLRTAKTHSHQSPITFRRSFSTYHVVRYEASLILKISEKNGYNAIISAIDFKILPRHLIEVRV